MIMQALSWLRRPIRNLRWWLWARRLERTIRAFKRDSAELKTKLAELKRAEREYRLRDMRPCDCHARGPHECACGAWDNT